MEDIARLLAGNRYPGRGIIIGMDSCSRRGLCAYFIMGRSENSRNRVFEASGGAVMARAYDESKVTDPSLIIYTPVLTVGGATVITNGDQTDTVAGFLRRGETFERALETRTYEPDAPNFTPRISAVAWRANGGFAYKMSIIKRGAGGEAERLFWEYAASPGEGRFIHTYRGDGDPLPAFEGGPVRVAIPDSLEGFASAVWGSLDGENKISLFARSVDLSTGGEETVIINKHSADKEAANGQPGA